MSRRHPSIADQQAVQRGLVAAGLPADYFGWEEILHLLQRGLTVTHIVRTAVEHAKKNRQAATTA